MDNLIDMKEIQEVEEDTSFGNDVIEEPFNPNDVEIETPPFTVGYLIDSIKFGEINMTTDFQRERNLWSQEKQSQLIESILLGLPLKRLNTGGLELTPQEIRNAIFQGKSADTVKHFAQFDEFKKATDWKIKTQRMEDRDFVSRFIAFYLIDYERYKPGLDDFINSSMEMLEKKDVKDIEHDFKKSLNLATDIFGYDAFRKRTNIDAARRPINKAYFEVITSTFAKLKEQEVDSLKKNKELFKNNLIILMNNDRYFLSLSQGKGTVDSVKYRFSKFQQVLEKSINGIKIKITDDNKIENSEL